MKSDPSPRLSTGQRRGLIAAQRRRLLRRLYFMRNHQITEKI